MIGLLAGICTPSDEKMSSDDPRTIKKPSYSDKQVYIFHPVASLTSKNTSAMMFEHIYGVASFIVILVALLCVFKMYLALTATYREDRAFLLESATREEQQNVKRGQRELEADRRSNAEEERPRGLARQRLSVQHDERRCPGVSKRFINSSYD